jgi:hypothetical protein
MADIKQIITDSQHLALAINEVGYENVINIVPCNRYDGCEIVVLYRG